MKDETIMDESKILKDSIIDAINRFKHETNMFPLIDIKVVETYVKHCEVSTKIEIKVMINI